MGTAAEAKDYSTALAERSSFVEAVLLHRLVADLASALWALDPTIQFQVFNAEVDDAGFDLVLGCEGQLRYVQVKQTHATSRPKVFAIRLPFSEMAGSCVVLIRYEAETLQQIGYQYYGAGVVEPMPALGDAAVSRSPGRRDRDTGERRRRAKYRDLRMTAFQSRTDASGLLLNLFPTLKRLRDAD